MSPPPDTQDFESYARTARPRLLRFAVVVTDDRELAQDVVQDVLLRAQRHWGRIARTDHPHAYVRRMIVNEVTSWRRKWARIEPRSDSSIDQVVDDPADAVDRRDAILRELSCPPVKQRAAVVLRYLEDLPDVEIAAVLGCSPGTVRVHIHRALARLRVDLSAPHAAHRVHS